MTKSTSGGCDQFETSPEANDQELQTAFCERRQTDILKGALYKIWCDVNRLGDSSQNCDLQFANIDRQGEL